MAEKVAEHQFSVPLYSHRIADLLQQWLDTPPDDPYQAMAEFPEAIIDACGQGAVMEKHFEELRRLRISAECRRCRPISGGSDLAKSGGGEVGGLFVL